mmetsp:Transcript_2551/g.3969  ORF Transcript_2551/g.3969 Transcript_2551/m.3969 type:complete len:421 (+) Transcript_2551:246-1508(+)|eukprot:CAMPEP_0196809828 /NCGR_PEP_ID=MMETSP1362-20130617/9702_1 /TAXON_ID=163516 /ORGANISM="Leptocylindrus danicus, Strain CCMP1856" /LENGTH=420 /DNA_ID=CAMNT_0042184627 /DNA_START=1469 /DNA_END=2731 /DNA_ORIENTATION=+
MMNPSTEFMSLREDELYARRKAEARQSVLFFVNLWSNLKTFWVYLVTVESAFGCLLAVALTTYVYFRTEEMNRWNGTMDWVLLGFAVVTPMSVTIGLAFRRREDALVNVARFKALAFQIYLAHSSWDWGTSVSGRLDVRTEMEWLKHSDDVLALIMCQCDYLCRFLTLPCSSRSRHRVTHAGIMEASRTIDASYKLCDEMVPVSFTKLSLLTEDLKRLGFSVTEANRIRMWERTMVEAIETLKMLKLYRTPQALRSFARLFTLLLPPFYSPTFAQLARDTHSLGLGIAFACMVSIALTALFASIDTLEDPFVAIISLDGIDVREELIVLMWRELITSRKTLFPHAPDIHDDQIINDSGIVSHPRAWRDIGPFDSAYSRFGGNGSKSKEQSSLPVVFTNPTPLNTNNSNYRAQGTVVEEKG